jgi:hypothetical protein
MAIFAKSSGSNYPKQVTPAGSHVARCYGMLEIGTEESEYKGEKKIGYKVIVDFELPLETAIFREGEAEKPFVISKEYNLSFHEKATLRKDLEAWRGAVFTEAEAESFDITRLVGKACMLNITHKKSADGTKTYANISSISPIPKGLQCPTQVNPTRILSYSDWDQELFMTLPEWLATKITKTPEFNAKFGALPDIAPQMDLVAEDNFDEPPF